MMRQIEPVAISTDRARARADRIAHLPRLARGSHDFAAKAL